MTITLGKVLILVQRYEFLSKSQLVVFYPRYGIGAYPCAKIRIFKQITTKGMFFDSDIKVLILVQRYEFLSKSQHAVCVFKEI